MAAPLAARSERPWRRSAADFTALYSSLGLLALLCLGWSLLALPLYALLPGRPARVLGRRAIMRGFAVYARWLQWIGACRLDLSALDALRGAPPLILAPNHPSLIDALLVLARHPNLACVMKADLMGNILLGPGARLARYIRNGSPRQMVREAVRELRAGGTLLLFPEGTRSTRTPVNPLARSVGVIARHSGVPVQTLLIDTDSPFLSKGWQPWQRPLLPITYRVRLGRRFDPPGRLPAELDAFMQELERYYRIELQGSAVAQWIGCPPCL